MIILDTNGDTIVVFEFYKDYIISSEYFKTENLEIYPENLIKEIVIDVDEIFYKNMSKYIKEEVFNEKIL